MNTVKFRVLGPLEMAVGGRRTVLAAAKPRSLLGLLLLNLNHVAQRDWLIEQLWDGNPPASAQSTLRAYAYQVRKQLVLGNSGVALHGRAGGYVLEAEYGTVDAHRFEALAARGRQALQDDEYEDAAIAFRAGLGLWRGEAAFADIGLSAVRNQARLLEDTRLESIEQCLGAELETGGPTAAIAELKALTAAHPLREGLWRLLMLSLYRAGRQSEALEAYQRLYRLLDDELAIRPSAPVRRLHEQILTGDPEQQCPAADNRPAEAVQIRDRQSPQLARLPVDLPYFTGRQHELARLRAISEDHLDGGRTPAIVAIDGMPGSGKTALAVHAAHRLAARYRDGQMLVDLHGYTPETPQVSARAALETVLRCLGVPRDRIPDSLCERANLYRCRTAGRQMLIVLDNVASAEQIEPLLPSEAGCMVIATGRNRPTQLAAADMISLGPMRRRESIELFARLVPGPRAAAATRADLEALVELCGSLPLAIRVAATRLNSHAAWNVAHLVRRLREGRRALVGSEIAACQIMTAIDQSYQLLSETEKGVYRLLGRCRISETDAAEVAAMSGLAVDDAQLILDRLFESHMLDEPAPSRYRLHDLIGLHAARADHRHRRSVQAPPRPSVAMRASG